MLPSVEEAVGLDKSDQNTYDCEVADGVSYYVTFASGADGTDANITLVMVGENGLKTAPLIVNSYLGNIGESAFEANDVDILSMTNCANIGLPQEIELSSDNSGPSPEWDVSFVSVRHEDGRETFFYPSRSLGGDQPGQFTLVATPERLEYSVSVTTGDNGTDSDLDLTFRGTNGNHEIGDVNQLLSGNVFESGDVDEFVFFAEDLGELEAVWITLRELTALSDTWTVEQITVTQGANEWESQIGAEIEGAEVGQVSGFFPFQRVR